MGLVGPHAAADALASAIANVTAVFANLFIFLILLCPTNYSPSARPAASRGPILQAAWRSTVALLPPPLCRRNSSASLTPFLLCGTSHCASPISTPHSVPHSMSSLNHPRCPIRKILPLILPRPCPSDR